MLNNKQNYETVNNKTQSNKWKIMTGVFGGLAAASIVTSIVVPLVVLKNNSSVTPEELKEHKINISQPTESGWDIKLIDTEAQEVSEAKKGTELILYMEQGETNDKKVPEYFTINDSERKYYFSSNAGLYYALFTIPEANEMTIKTYFAEAQETVDLTFSAGDHATIEGVTSLTVPTGTTFGSITNLPTVKADDGYKFVGWYVNDTKVTSETKFETDTTIVAKCTTTEYKTLTFNYDSNKGKLYYNSEIVASGTTVQIEAGTAWGDLPHPSPIPEAGYAPSGFYINGEYLTPDYIFDADATITAEFVDASIDISTSNCLGLDVVADSTIQWRQTGTTMLKPVIYYTTSTSATVPSADWLELKEGTVLDLTAGTKLFLRSLNFAGISDRYSYVNFKILPKTGTEGSVKLSGPLCALLDGGFGTDAKTIPSDYAFQHLFQGSTGLISVYNSKEIAMDREGCCRYMFSGCINLETSNIAPTKYLDYAAQEMYKNCYKLTGGFSWKAEQSFGVSACESMFYDCKSLLSNGFDWYSGPNERKLAKSCFMNMFWGCESYTSFNLTGSAKGVLYNAHLGEYACLGMFRGSGIQKIPDWALAPKTCSNYACESMFAECKSLTSFEDIGVWVTLNESSGVDIFQQMFRSCTNLTNANVAIFGHAPARCCSSMFIGCEKLQRVNLNLAATTVSESCYSSMFNECKTLSRIYSGSSAELELPALTLAEKCYQSMFMHCYELTNAPVIKATKLAANSCETMFGMCMKLKVNNTKSGTKFFTCPTIIPNNAVKEMFAYTGGSYKQDPVAGQSYYFEA